MNLCVALLLAACITLCQGQIGYITTFDAINGTVSDIPISFYLGNNPGLLQFPQIMISMGATVYGNTSIYTITEFYDRETNATLWKQNTFGLIYSTNSNTTISSSQNSVISPCSILGWTYVNASLLGARTTVNMQTTSVLTNMTATLSIQITSTLMQGNTDSFRSTNPTTYVTFLTPAANESSPRINYNANFNITQTRYPSVDFPFSSYCVNRNGSCSNSRCLVEEDFDDSDSDDMQPANATALSPSGVYFMSLSTTGDNIPFTISIQLSEQPMPSSSSTTGGGIKKPVRFNLPLWAVVLIAVGGGAIVIGSVVFAIIVRRRARYSQIA